MHNWVSEHEWFMQHVGKMHRRGKAALYTSQRIFQRDTHRNVSCSTVCIAGSVPDHVEHAAAPPAAVARVSTDVGCIPSPPKQPCSDWHDHQSIRRKCHRTAVSDFMRPEPIHQKFRVTSSPAVPGFAHDMSGTERPPHHSLRPYD